MAVVSVAGAGFRLAFNDLDFSSFTNVTDALATGFSLNFSDGSRWDVTGFGLVYGGPSGLPSAGTITSIALVEPSDLLAATAAGLSMSAASFAGFVVASNETAFFDALLVGGDSLSGGALADDMRGGAGTDVVWGGSGSDRLLGEDGADVIVADAVTLAGGSDTVFGGGGSDYVVSGSGNDTVYGDAEADWLEGGHDADSLTGGNGDDVANGEAGNDVLEGGDGNDYAAGGDGDDALSAASGNDWLEGGSGNDVIDAGIGNDYASGGAGADVLSAGDGDDIAEGDAAFAVSGAGNDTIYGGNGLDAGFGGAGNDRVYGGADGDLLAGGVGNDWLFGGTGNDLLLAEADHDVLAGDAGIDSLFGGLGNDLLLGGSEADTLFGDDGDDRLEGGTGNDVLVGGIGTDVALYAGAVATIGSSGETLTIDAGAQGIDTLIGVEQIGAPDSTPPGPPSITGFSDDTGTTGDAITSDATPTLSGTAEANALVTVFRNAVSIGTTGADEAGNWSFTSAALALGSHAFTATATDLAGNTGAASSTLSLHIVSAPLFDLTSLGGSQGFILQGNTNAVGIRVSSAGDVNGDGFDDLIVAAPYNHAGASLAGEVYVVFGAAGGFGVAVTTSGVVRQVIDLASLAATQGFVVQGDTADDRAGLGVSSAGDVNGDGFDDLIVGARTGDDGGANAGEAYVVFGTAGGFGVATTTNGVVRQVIDLTSLDATRGFIVQGDTAGDLLGIGVASAGDVNGDGYNDLIVGATSGNDGGSLAGEAYVVFGAAAGFGVLVTTSGVVRQVIDLTSLDATQGFIVQGDTDSDRVGYNASSAGDVNGDGFDDLIVGARRGDDGGDSAGEAYVVFGAAGGFGVATTTDGVVRQVIDLTSLEAAQGFIVQGDTIGDYLGFSVASAGDVNGDGFDDLITGARSGDDGGNAAGEAYVVFGAAGGFGVDVTTAGVVRRVIDLTSLGSAQGFIIQGDTDGDFAGGSVASAGDVNGDGFDDLIVGAARGDDGGTSAGEAYVVFGAAGGFGVAVTTDGFVRQVVDLTSLGEAQGFIVRGDTAGDYAGVDVSSAGDVNGDGFDDLIVGAYGGDDGGMDAGEAYVLFGAAFGSVAGIVVVGSAGNDILIGGRGNDTLDAGDGGADILRAGAGDDLLQIGSTGFADIDAGTGIDTLALLGGSQTLDLRQAVPAELQSIEHIDLGGVGDNTLILDRLAAFSLTEERTGGQAIIRVEGDAGDTVRLIDGGWSLAGTTVEGGTSFDRFVQGQAELRIEQGLQVEALAPLIDLVVLRGTQGFIIRGDTASDFAGGSVSSAGDVNGDGYDDLIVGASGGDDGGNPNAGEAYVVFGRAVGFGTAVTTSGVVRQVIDLTSLVSAQGFIIQGDVGGDVAGGAVASAGDVNGDGLADLIVGAVGGSDGGNVAGEAYVVFGSTAGFGVAVTAAGVVRQVIDLASIGSAQGFIIQGDSLGDFTGRSVSSAGDVNGDGIGDLLVGADGGDNITYAGEAYVVFGTAAGFGVAVTAGAAVRQVVDLTSLGPAQGFIVQGDTNGDRAGFSVASAGDVNGDGFDDLVVGARGGDDGGSDAGEAYVLFGAAGGFGVAVTTGGVVRQVIDLTSLVSAQGFIIQGDTAGDTAGNSVSAAGDVNGDGFDDLIVGARYGDDGGIDAGEAYVLFGAAAGFGVAVTTGGVVRQVVDLTSLGTAQGFVIQGDTAGDRAGVDVASAGDVNGDGFADLIVGASFADDGGYNAGEAYVVLGGTGAFGAAVTTAGAVRQVLDLTSLGTAQGFIVRGDTDSDYAGTSVSSAGDVNGDGFDDLIVGANAGDDGGLNAGEAYVLFGAAFGSGAPIVQTGGAGNDLLIGDRGNDTLDGGSAGADILRGGAGNDLLRIGSSGFADIDGGNGVDTLALTGSSQTLDLRQATPSEFQGIEWFDLSGNGDNILIVDHQAALDLSEERIAGRAIVHIEGNAGDVVGLSDAGWSQQGSTIVSGIVFDRWIQGNAELRVEQGVAVAQLVIDLTSLGSAQGFIIQGDTNGDSAGFSVASAGDVNGDGFGDVIVGAHTGGDGGSGAGEAYVVFGAAGGFGTAVTTLGAVRQVVDLTSLVSAQGFIIQGDTNGDHAGMAVSSAGDIDGDGFSDLIVGAPDGDDGGMTAGEAYVVFGAAGGFGVTVTAAGVARQVIDLASLVATQGFIIQGDTAGDWTGRGVSSAGDVNGDGHDDLIVGAPLGSDGGAAAGEAYVMFGAAGGFGVAVTSAGVVRQVIDLTSLGTAEGFIVQGDTDNDRTGFSVASAGDMNGDGFDDLIVGAYNNDNGGNEAGQAYVVFGSGSGFGTLDGTARRVVDLTSLGTAQGFVIRGDTDYDHAGQSVSSAGDVNGDGFDDLIVGARYGNDGGAYAGEAYVLFGGAGSFGVAVTSGGVVRQVIDLTSLSTAQGFIIQGDTDGDYVGFSVASAGDVNGDGFGDLIVGARGSDDGGDYAGAAYVLFGSAGGFGTAVTTNGVARQVLDLTSLTLAQGFMVRGDTEDDEAGGSVSSAGDVNGDGFDDLIVGADHGDDGGSGAGEAYVLFGAPFGTAGPIVLVGNAGANILIGDRADDTLTGGGGADVLRGGAGNDVLVVPDFGFADIDGGTGIDTLVMSGGGQTLDLRVIGSSELQGIERIDLAGSGNNTLVLDELAVFGLTELRGVGGPAVAVRGNAGDAVEIDIDGAETWTLVGSAALDGVSYDRYRWDADGAGALAPMANAELWLDQDLGVSFI